MQGTPIPVVEGVAAQFDGYGHYGVGANGTLLYVPIPSGDEPRSLVWVDRQGNEEPIVAEERLFRSPRVSPDGRQIVIEIGESVSALAQTGDNPDIWMYDLPQETLTRFTFDPAEDRDPLWTPDGERIVFASTRDGDVQNLFWQAADGSGQVERLTESAELQRPLGFLPDGDTLLFDHLGALRTLPMSGERQAEILLQGARDATVSPDGRWLAYVSSESGQNEVWVRPFPNVEDRQWPISNGPGMAPVWGPDGGELFYLTRTDSSTSTRMMAVAYEAAPTFRPATPVELFNGPYFFDRRSFDVSGDTGRFLMIRDPSNAESDEGELIVVLNWFEELKRLVPIP